MKVISVVPLAIEAVKVIRFARFCDNRGYFTETYRKSDAQSCLPGIVFSQINESFSKSGTVRGMHFQWNPYMGKLVRTIRGRMVDLVLDIRRTSPTFGKIIAYDMPADNNAPHSEWIWVPPGFAHGNFFTEETTLEYLCSGEYSQGCEAGISPLAQDIAWDLCDTGLKRLFDSVAAANPLMTDKDRTAMTLKEWAADPRSENFVYGKI